MWFILLLVTLFWAPRATALEKVVLPPHCLIRSDSFDGIEMLRDPMIQLVGGYSGSGGGSGKACFPSLFQAIGAFDKNGTLTPEGRAQVSHLWVLDLFEMDNRSDFFPTQGMSPKQYLDWVLDTQWAPYSPSLVAALKDALAGLDRAEKSDRRDLPFLRDQGIADSSLPVEDQGEWCMPVQLAIRRQVHQDGSRPRLALDYDADLISRLGDSKSQDSRTWNLAALRLHEAIGTDAMELGQMDSLRAREFVRRLLSKSYHDMFLKLDTAGRAQFIEAMMESIRFLNLPALYPGKGNEAKADGSRKYSKTTRQKSFEDVQTEIRNGTRSFLGGKDPRTAYFLLQDPKQAALLREYLFKNVYPHFSDEEAFLMNALQLSLTGTVDSSGHPLDPYVLITSGLDDQKALTEICKKLIPQEKKSTQDELKKETGSSALPGETKKIFNSVDRYCHAVGR